ncbi:hypothetical protein VPNG_05297 [Cytospora leucostoma]|uniref:Mid2 domain-containing protein n=1 Tax=Cytospora leucostoma TaxID=1230097 RepID=A0A423X5A5_9PEZI|nr:hypothetical protein VPNG_05297 [Cytospora leucostoma]
MRWEPNGAGQSITVNNVVLAQQDDSGTTSLIANGSDTGSSSTAASQARSLAFERDGDTTQDAQSFPVDYSGGSLTLTNTLVTSTLAKHTDKTLFFQVEWTDAKGSTGYSYSLPWAVTDELADAYTLMDRQHALDRTGSPIYVDGSSPQVDAASTAASSSTLSSTDSTSSSTSTAAAGSTSKSKSHGLSTGAIVGIAIGCVAGLIIMGVIAGCFCFRRRKSKGVHGEAVPKGAHTMQDVIAEKEARVGILEGEQPDTPYSEQGSHRAAAAAAQHPRSRGLILAGMNESGVDMGNIGQAATSNDRPGGCNNRSSVVYSPLGGAPTPATGAPVVLAPTIGGSNAAPKHTQPLSLAIHEGTSMMDPAQHDGAFTPYTDHPAGVVTAPCPLQQQQQQQQQAAYNRHHHVVDGAGLAQQGHLGDEAARHEQQQEEEEQQPISPDSARGVCPGSTPRTRGDAFGRRSTTPSGISGRYAHLVEEGMTDDEIRRLEEEERALDEAIEEAGRGLAR